MLLAQKGIKYPRGVAMTLALGLFGTVSPVSVQSASDPTQTVEAIDWGAVKEYSPIPSALPTGSSDDPVEAGFSVEWIRRSLETSEDSGPTFPPGLKLALAIASQRRQPGDRWAHLMEQELREIIRTRYQGQRPPIARVFCNALGCLCYLQGEKVGEFDIHTELVGPAGRRFGIQPNDLSMIGVFVTPGPQENKWWLTIVRRPRQTS